MFAYIIIIMLLVLFGLSAYGLGVSHGAGQRKQLMCELGREVKTNIKADSFSQDALFGEGAENDTLEPGDFEKRKSQQPLQGDRGFWA